MIPHPALITFIHAIVHDRFRQHRSHNFSHGQVDILPFARPLTAEQSSLHGVRHHHSNHVIRPASAQATRRTILIAGQMTNPSRRLSNWPPAHTVAIRTRLANRSPGDHNNIRLDLTQIVVAHTPTFHHSAGKILDHNITLFDEIFGQSNSAWMAQVESDAFFTVIEPIKERRAIRRNFFAGILSQKANNVWTLV